MSHKLYSIAGIIVAIAVCIVAFFCFINSKDEELPKHFYAEASALVVGQDAINSAIYHSTMDCESIKGGVQMDKYWCKCEKYECSFCPKCMSQDDILACKDHITS